MERRTIAGRYELIEQIGDSSWRATDTELGREVLIRLRPGDVAATLAHPNIVHLFDQGEDDGERYAVLEYLPGGSLEQRLAAGPLTEAEANAVATDVDAALAYAHEQGVTHGSLRPANVLFDIEGRAKLTSFTGAGTPEDDRRALATLLEVVGANAIAVPEADVTEVMPAPPAATSRRRLALAAIVALVLVTAGVAAAFLATSGDSSSDSATTSLSVPAPTESTAPTTQEPASSAPTTTAEPTTQATTTEPTTTEATTTAPRPTTSAPPPATTTAPPTTEPPPPTTEPPPATTEEPPPTTTG